MLVWRFRMACFAILAAAPLLASGGNGADSRIHERTGKVRLHGPASRTFLFFTPEGEKAWAGEGWDPRAFCTRSGKDEEGMVFRNGTNKPLWLVTRLDPSARVVEYAIVAGDLLTVLHIEVAAAGDDESVATVGYQWIVRTEAGSEKAASHDRHFTPMLESWQEAMNAVLAGKPAPAGH